MSEETKEVIFKNELTRQHYFAAIKKAHDVAPAMVTASDVQDMFLAAGIDKIFADIETLTQNYLERH